MRVKLRVSKYYKSVMASGNPAQIYLRANDVYDPEGSAGAAQPQGFSEWTSLYRRFVVLGSTCRVDLMNESAFTAHAVLVASNESTSGLNVEEALSNPFQVSTMLAPSTANGKVILVKSATTAEIVGVPQ